jgi:Transposase DDE domain group 1
MEHLLALASPRRQVLFTCGWAITAADEQAIALLPGDAWKPGVDQDGRPERDKHVAEVTHLMSRAPKWADGLRRIVRRARPSRRQSGNLTAFEKKTGWRYSITCTNIPLRGIAGKAWQVNCGWVLAASIAADLAAWTRLIGLHDQEGLSDAEPQTLRYRLWHLPARLAAHARQRTLKFSPSWPWKDAFITCRERLNALPAPA